MKNTFLLLTILLFIHVSRAQESSTDAQPNITVKWAPTGLILGSASLQAEYNFGGRNSLTAKIGFPVNARHTFTYEDEDAAFDLKATSFLAGYRTYFSKKRHLRGLYYEPFFSYVHHTSEGIGHGTLDRRPAVFNLTNNYSGFGIGVQLGAQFFVGKHFVIDWFFLGPQISAATNSFVAIETTNALSWNDYAAEKAARDIEDFLNQFPLIRNKTSVMVDKEMKRVSAEFKGVLPGVRTGVSIGFAF